MTKKEIQEAFDGMNVYIPIRLIESELKMPATTIQKVLTDKRELPKKWDKVLKTFFESKANNPFTNAARGRDKSGINEDELLTFAKPKIKTVKKMVLGESIKAKETTPESYDAPPMDKFIQDEFGQMRKHGFAKEDIAVIEKLKEAGEELKSLLDGNPPVRQKDEDPIDFAARKNEWKKAHNKK